jgi:peptidoglycan hydrolase-like protein with peptidoglycan-binding domain
MKPCGPWLKIGAGIATTVVLVCGIPFAHSGRAAAKPKSTAHKVASKGFKSSKTKSQPGARKSASHPGKKSRKVSRRGQQKIDSERTHQIQDALIRQHYMRGEPTGKWDATTEDALRRYQADNGWQNKTVPDSRALIKLGLGPNHDHLLNPESAMTTMPQTPRPTATPSTSPAPAGSPNQPQP